MSVNKCPRLTRPENGLPQPEAEGSLFISEILFKSRSQAEENMGIKPEFAFDVCWEVYRGAREILEAKRGSVAAFDWQQDSKYLWRPDLRPNLKDWVADFTLAGQATLDEPERASRMVLFRWYYLGLAEYNRDRHFLGVSEYTRANWQRAAALTIAPHHSAKRRISLRSAGLATPRHHAPHSNASASPTRNTFPASILATRVFVDSR